MQVSFNQNSPYNRQRPCQTRQNTSFGSVRTAENLIDNVKLALKTEDPKFKITPSKALEMYENALKSEDNIGIKLINRAIANLKKAFNLE